MKRYSLQETNRQKPPQTFDVQKVEDASGGIQQQRLASFYCDISAILWQVPIKPAGVLRPSAAELEGEVPLKKKIRVLKLTLDFFFKL